MCGCICAFFLFNDPATSAIYTFPTRRSSDLTAPPDSPATAARQPRPNCGIPLTSRDPTVRRSEEHTSELQSRFDLVCRLLLEKKNKLTASSITIRFDYMNTIRSTLHSSR